MVQDQGRTTEECGMFVDVLTVMFVMFSLAYESECLSLQAVLIGAVVI